MSEVVVRTIMRRDFPQLAPYTPIRRAVALLLEARADAAPVLEEDGRLAGILTQKDCFRPVLHASYYREWTGSVADHMSREVVSVDPEMELIAAAELFMTHPHRVFPVSDSRDVLGMLHRSAVLARLMQLG